MSYCTWTQPLLWESLHQGGARLSSYSINYNSGKSKILTNVCQFYSFDATKMANPKIWGSTKFPEYWWSKKGADATGYGPHCRQGHIVYTALAREKQLLGRIISTSLIMDSETTRMLVHAPKYFMHVVVHPTKYIVCHTIGNGVWCREHVDYFVKSTIDNRRGR